MGAQLSVTCGYPWFVSQSNTDDRASDVKDAGSFGARRALSTHALSSDWAVKCENPHEIAGSHNYQLSQLQSQAVFVAWCQQMQCRTEGRSGASVFDVVHGLGIEWVSTATGLTTVLLQDRGFVRTQCTIDLEECVNN